MKIEGKKPEPDFKPVRVTFTFETQDELDVIGSLFNSGNLAIKLNELLDSCDYYYEVFKELGADINKYTKHFRIKDYDGEDE